MPVAIQTILHSSNSLSGGFSSAHFAHCKQLFERLQVAVCPVFRKSLRADSWLHTDSACMAIAVANLQRPTHQRQSVPKRTVRHINHILHERQSSKVFVFSGDNEVWNLAKQSDHYEAIEAVMNLRETLRNYVSLAIGNNFGAPNDEIVRVTLGGENQQRNCYDRSADDASDVPGVPLRRGVLRASNRSTVLAAFCPLFSVSLEFFLESFDTKQHVANPFGIETCFCSLIEWRNEPGSCSVRTG